MKKTWMLFIMIIMTTVAILLVANPSSAQGTAQPNLADLGTDSNPDSPPLVIIPTKYKATNAQKISAAVTGVSGVPVYFTPQDENTSTTVLFIYNTNSVESIVGLQTYSLNGSVTIDTSFVVPPLGLVRVCGDEVSTSSASWQDYILVNFTTFSAYAKLTLPKGVKADGYVVYNPTGTYDPLTAAQMLPLRFSVKAKTVP